MKKLLLGMLLIASAMIANAQQDAQFTHYSFNNMYLNPAYAGIQRAPVFRAIYRNHWTGYTNDFDANGAGHTEVISGDMPIPSIGAGLGLNIVNDVQPSVRYTSIQLSFSKHIKIGDGLLSAGLQGSFSNMLTGRGETFVWRTPDTPAEDDPAIAEVGYSEWIGDMAAGVWYQDKAKDPTYYVGLSLNRLLDKDYKYTRHTEGKDDGGSKKHMYLTGGYNIEVDYNLIITPTLLYKTDFAQADNLTHSIEVGAKAEFDKTYWGGLNFRQGGDLGILIGASFLERKELKVGYAIDLVLAGTAAKAGTSHEIMLAYYMPDMVKMPKPILRTPRYKF